MQSAVVLDYLWCAMDVSQGGCVKLCHPGVVLSCAVTLRSCNGLRLLPLHLETYTENSGWRKRLKHEEEKLSLVCLSSARSLM